MTTQAAAVEVPIDRLRSFGEAAYRHAGLIEEDARIVVEVQLTADLRGVDTHGFQRLFKNRELREQLRWDAFTGLVSGIQIVAERFHHMVGGDPDVGHSLIDHRQDRAQHAAHGRDLLAVLASRLGESKEMPEQLVCAVNQVNVHEILSACKSILYDWPACVNARGAWRKASVDGSAACGACENRFSAKRAKDPRAGGVEQAFRPAVM